jgi:hypothetical protein
MHRAISVSAEAPITTIMPVVADLSTYPSWLGLVYAAQRVEDSDNTFQVTLRAKVGPFARSKKLRMERTHLSDDYVRFERAETDGRQHSNWTMTIQAEPGPSGGSDLEIALDYDGDLWSGPLQLILDAQANKAAGLLDAYVLATSEGV